MQNLDSGANAFSACQRRSVEHQLSTPHNMTVLADGDSSMEQQKSTDVLLMELMGLALGWEFEGASEHRALVKRLYQAAQEERKAANSRFLHLREKQASYEKEIDSLRAKLANTEATTDDSQHSEIGKKTSDEVGREGSSNGEHDFMHLERARLTKYQCTRSSSILSRVCRALLWRAALQVLQTSRLTAKVLQWNPQTLASVERHAKHLLSRYRCLMPRLLPQCHPRLYNHKLSQQAESLQWRR